MRHGEIYKLGKHRLMCGDATNKEDVMRLLGEDEVNLVLTDPPYGMKCQDKNGYIGDCTKECRTLRQKLFLSARKHPMLINDNSSEAARKNYEIVCEITKKLIFWGGQYFADFLPVNGGWIFWDKLTGNNDFSDGELAWRSWGKRVYKYSQLWNGVCMEGNYALNGRDKTARIHPTQKPVELHAKILEDFSQPEDVILDCFGGSGTTLIACEITGRTCLMMEILPEYCQVIADRYSKLTGIEAVLINDS